MNIYTKFIFFPWISVCCKFSHWFCRLGLFALIASQAAVASTVIKLGYQQTIWGSPAMVAVALHVWKGSGITVEPIALSSGKAVRDAVLAGSVDVGTLGATPYIVGAARANLVTVGTVAYAGKTLSLIGRKGKVTSAADLRGKVIGSKLGSSTNQILVTKVLPALGLKKNQYRIDNVTFSDQVSALASGSISAFAGVEPYNALAVKNGIGVRITNFGKYDMSPLFLAMKGAFYSSHTKEVQVFVRGWQKAVKYYNDNPVKSAKIVANIFDKKGLSLPLPIIEKGMSEMDVTMKYRPGLKGYIDHQLIGLKLSSDDGKLAESLK